jgi:signal transduction histidine kinase
VVLLDLSPSDDHRLETVANVRARFPNLPIVVLGAPDDELLAAGAIREGAEDFLAKERLDGRLLIRSLCYAIERKRAEQERERVVREQEGRAEVEVGQRFLAALVAENARLRRETQAQSRLREDRERRKDQFLAAATHDLKTPLATIKGLAQLLQRRAARPGGLDQARLQEGLDKIDLTVSRLAEMVNELLDASRVQMGRALTLDRRPTDLVALARRLAAAYDRTTDRHLIRVDAPEGSLVGNWDEVRLERVLSSLLDNAVKYSPGGGEIVVRVAAEWRSRELDGDVREGLAVLSVADHGLGVPADETSAVFEPFYRASNVGELAEGAGIGLAGARQIVEQHGGTIELESQAGSGSTFTIRLPLGS